MSNDSKNDDDKLLYCSFCGKSQHEVKKLIAGPTVFICDECADKLELLGFTIEFDELIDNEGDSENDDWCCHFCRRSSKEKVQLMQGWEM